MIKEWNKFKGWSVLEYFLLNPNIKIHINELSRRLGIGLRTAQKFCSEYKEEGLLNKKEIGNIHQYYINEKDQRIKILKKFIGPYLASDQQYLKPFIEKNKNVLSIALYGSFSKGDYGNKSDLDILVITSNEQKINNEDFLHIGSKLEREINVMAIPLDRWRKIEREKTDFFNSVKKNNVLIWGNAI
ncbi:MAG: nucleotidyltransferase domain-containing protein [Candidatus Micrarchaeia archaeon]